MSHITHKVGDKEYCIVQVPKGSWCHSISRNDKVTGVYQHRIQKLADIPEGNYTKLFVAEQATESEAEQVVEKGHYQNPFMYVDYQCADWACIKATNSIMSLIRANFPNHSEMNHIVLIKNEKI